MKIKTSELTGAALDWAATYAQHGEAAHYIFKHNPGFHSYSTDWSQGGPIIEREGMHILCWSPGSKNPWIAATTKPASRMTEDNYYPDGGTGPTPLVAAMRCHVGQKLGDIVEIPEELC